MQGNHVDKDLGIRVRIRVRVWSRTRVCKVEVGGYGWA